MKIEQKKGYKLIVTDDVSFENFFSSFQEKYETLTKNHIIIKISDKISIENKDIFVLLSYADSHKENNMTFVIVCKRLDVDKFPETFNIVPTIQEAEDVLEMENIQRDLGF